MINEKIDILLKDYEPGHTEYQIENFIVGSEVHPWHRYCQCLREISARNGLLKEKERGLILLTAEINDLESRRRRWLSRRQKHLVKIENKKKAGRNLTLEILEVRREIKIFIKIGMEMRSRYDYGSLNFERRKILEAEAWREKAKYMLCMDLFCIGRPSKQTVEFIYKLPKAVKRELLMQIDPRDKQKIIEYLIE
jgi:hypothetical protein